MFEGSLRAAWFAALATTLCACAPLAPVDVPGRDGAAAVPASSGDIVAPNPNLLVQGIPPIPRSLAEQVGRYNDFAGHRFVDWHPTRREMLVSHRRPGTNTTQIFVVGTPLGAPRQLTDFAEPVRTASYEPITGDYIVFERSTGGDEAAQLHRLDLATMRTAQLTEPGQRHDMQRWLNRSSRLLYLSLPLDRTAAGGSRAAVVQTLWIMDPARPESRRKLAELPGGGWDVAAVSWDDRLATLTEFISVAESRLWLLDLGSGERRQLLPSRGAPASAHYGGAWKRDDSGFFLVSDRGGEFLELMFYRLADASLTRISRTIPWDIEDMSLDSSGRLLAVRANVEGRSELRFFDADTFGELPSPSIAAGSVETARFHPRLPALAVTLDESRAAGQVGVLDPSTGALQRWTQPFIPPGVDAASFGEQRIVRWTSFDGRTISGIVNMPPARFTGKRPVLIQVHGGPEGQATFGFIGRLNHYVEDLGIAVIQPNVRGSSGFGKTFLSLDNGVKREDSVKDIGALLDWIGQQPGLDVGRVLVAGGSYGGYMSLAVAATYPERIAGAIDVVGISNFVSFLENTESYRRDLRRVEYGDEREPAMREFLTRISPLTQSAKIGKPLFVVQGRNDPRVPYTEAEQIVARVRANGTPVWYLRAENEGHGFARKENADFQFYATVMFMRETVLKPAPGGTR